MTDRTTVHALQVATNLYRFVEDQVLPGTGISNEAFWKGFPPSWQTWPPANIALLAERDRLQTELDTWHRPTRPPSRTWWPTAASRKDRLPGAPARRSEGHHHQRGR